MRNLRLCLVAAAIAACGGNGTGLDQVEGNAASDIVSGNDQVMTADQVNADAQRRLPSTMVHKMVRVGSSVLAASAQLAGANALDTLKGSPIVGAVVCAGGGDGNLVPFAVCTNTNAEGKSVWAFSTTTKAGDPWTEIRGFLAGQPVVFDTARAKVRPGLPDTLGKVDNIGQRASPAAFLATHVVDRFGNAVAYRIPADKRLTPGDTTAGTAGARTVTFTAASVDSTWTTLTLTDDLGAPVAQFTYRLVLPATPRIQAVICGLAVKQCVSATHVP